MIFSWHLVLMTWVVACDGYDEGGPLEWDHQKDKFPPGCLPGDSLEAIGPIVDGSLQIASMMMIGGVLKYLSRWVASLIMMI